MSDLVEQIDALLALNAKGAVSHPVPGLAVELLERAKSALASRTPNTEVVKALEWRVPTDHPSDPDIEENVYCADGVGGKYAISKKQKVGPERLLWMADDPFDWKGFNSIEEAKAAAQADYEARILSAIVGSAK